MSSQTSNANISQGETDIYTSITEDGQEQRNRYQQNNALHVSLFFKKLIKSYF